MGSLMNLQAPEGRGTQPEKRVNAHQNQPAALQVQARIGQGREHALAWKKAPQARWPALGTPQCPAVLTGCTAQSQTC